MSYRCPTCERALDEAGFCPFDGTKLVADREESSNDRAPTELERSEFDADSGIETNPAVSVSASTAHTRAMEMMSGAEHDEYDRLIGQTLDDRYVVVKKIGEGGMGVVFAVRHAVIERPLAIKVLKRAVMRDAATIKRFVQEAKAASRIGHPNIVDVTDFGTTPDGLTYSVMEFVDGTTLSQTLRRDAPLMPERAVRIAVQIARALAAAHDKGIVHRDLKPENVFLIDRDGRPDFVKIVDFGIAKVQPASGLAEDAPRLTRVGSVFGTPEYMAPEQAAGRGDTDARVDIYALGTILYEMIVGHVPHRGESVVRTLAMQMLDPIVPPSQATTLPVLPALEAVVMKALAKQREDRHATMHELQRALEDVAKKLGAITASASALTLTPPAPSDSFVGSLSTLPPGADTEVDALQGPTLSSAGPRRNKPQTKQLHEPEFVASRAKPLQVFDEPAVTEAPPRRWPLVAALLVVLGAGGAVAFVVLGNDGSHGDGAAIAARDAGHGEPGPTKLAEVPADAADALPAPADAAIVEPHHRDAGVRVAAATRDAGAGGANVPHPAQWTIEVLTRPGDASLFDGRTYRGPSGTHITDDWGKTLNLECRSPGKRGKVRVVFDGSRDSVMCTAIPPKGCGDGAGDAGANCEVPLKAAPKPGAQGPVVRPTDDGNSTGSGPGPVTSPGL